MSVGTLQGEGLITYYCYQTYLFFFFVYDSHTHEEGIKLFNTTLRALGPASGVTMCKTKAICFVSEKTV